MKKQPIIIIWLITTLALVFFILDRKKNFSYKPPATFQTLYQISAQSDANKQRTMLTPHEIHPFEKAILDSIQTEASTEEILIATAKIVENYIGSHRGKMDSLMYTLHPITQLLETGKRNATVDCGNFVTITSYILHRIGLKCRLIDSFNESAEKNPGVHSMLEVYMPEHKKWILVDPMAGNYLFRSDSTILNLLDIRKAIIQNNTRDIQVGRVRDDHFHWTMLSLHNRISTTYLSPPNKVRFYTNTNLSDVYSISEKIKRYLLPVNWFSVYPTDKNQNLGFYIRMAASWTWLISSVILIYLHYHDRSKKY